MNPLKRFGVPAWASACLFSLVALGVAAVIYINVVPNAQQREFAGVSTVWGLDACLLLIASATALLAREVVGLLGKTRSWVALGFLVGGIGVCEMAPNTNRIYFDEHIYEHIGQSIAATGIAQSANIGRAEFGQFQPSGGWVNKQPNGNPYTLSWFFRIFGMTERVAHWGNMLYTGLGAFALYVALSLVPWGLPRGAAGAVAGLHLATPLLPWWGHTVSSEAGAASTAAMAFMGAVLYVRLRDEGSLTGRLVPALLFGALLAFASNFRPESLLVFPVAIAVILSCDRRLWRDSGALAALALGVTLTIPNLAHLWSMRTEDWGATDGRRFDYSFIEANLRSNAGYFVDGKWFPITGTILALAGLYWLARYKRWGLTAALTWFLPAWGIFVLFYAGGYHYGASSRYGVISIAPVAVFMGIGAAWLFAALQNKPLLRTLLITAGVMNWGCAYKFVHSESREASEARADVSFAADSAKLLPAGSIVLAQNPGVWNMLGVNSAQVFVLESQVRTDLNELRRQFPGGVYLHWNFWHNVEPAFAVGARQLVLDTQAQLIARRQFHDHKVGIFRLDTPQAVLKYGGSEMRPRRVIDMDDVLTELAAPAPAPVSPAPAVREQTPPAVEPPAAGTP